MQLYKSDCYPLFRELQKRLEAGKYCFHVPAHHTVPEKRSCYDLTELPGLDLLYAPTGCIAEAQSLAAAVFQSERTYFLVNGSSAGLTATLAALCRPGDRLVMGRNSHRSAAAGLIISGARPHFLPVDELESGVPLNIKPAALSCELENMTELPRAILITSPSYWGICTGLDSISRIAGRVGVPLVIDEAHGGHFLFHPAFPQSAATAGANVWVNSAHKTLGALTPGAYLHLKGNNVPERTRLEMYLSLLQTSSPSYPVMMSLDLVRGRFQNSGFAELDKALAEADWLKRRLKELDHFCLLTETHLPDGYALDPLRITLFWNTIGLDGFTVQDILDQEFGIGIEMAGLRHLVFLVHPGLQRKASQAMIQALHAIEKRSKKSPAGDPGSGSYPIPPQVTTPREAVEGLARNIKLIEAAGEVSAQLLTPYPPGIPVLYPGEMITRPLIERVYADLSAGVTFLELAAQQNAQVSVLQ